MISPPFLNKGDKVAIVAPARKISREELSPALDLLSSWGLEPVPGKYIFSAYHQFAGTDEERTYDLQLALDNASISAILCARGGYGTVRVIDALDFSTFVKKPKWIVGYSDATVLHSHIHRHCGIETIHATMPINFMKNSGATGTLRNVLFGELPAYTVAPHPLNRTGYAEGVLTGGNLSLLYALSGTSSDIDTKGKILFIEDLDEYLYHIDRMMMNLKRAGKLHHLSGLIVGGMTEMKDNTVPFGKTPEEIIYDAVKEYNYPVCFGFPAGHIDDNRALILGRKMALEVHIDNCLLH